MFRQLARLPLAAVLVLAVGTVGCTDPVRPLTGAHDAPVAAAGRAPNPAVPVVLGAPVFGLDANPDGSLLAATVLAGISEVRGGQTTLIASLPGVSGVAAIGRGNLLAITGEPADADFPDARSRKLFRISRGNVREIADFWAFEQTVNPDAVWNTSAPDSNPFSITALAGGRALVADAGANAILIVDERGAIDWVAVLTPQPASTAPLKETIGCASAPGHPLCGLPPFLPAEPVATAIAVGPDGAYYAGELTGFPATPGIARVWRIAPGSRHVLCPSAACTLVATGFTSIMDMAFGSDGTLYVVELDTASWFASISAGFPMLPVAGGRVQACNVTNGACTVRASGLSLPTAVAVTKDGTVWIAENDAIHVEPGHAARIRALP